jgi:hypothetical protein
MAHVSFSPIEEDVLQALGAEWSTLEDLQKAFYPDNSPEVVRAAVGYLKGKELIAQIDRQSGEPLFEQTPLGLHAIAMARRARVAVPR